MDTNRLRQFKVIAETANLRKSAEILGISHAGLSKSLRTLEEELQTALTIREGRGIRISTKGKELLRQISICIEAEDQLRAIAQGLSPAGHEAPLRIGTFEVFSTYVAPSIALAAGKDRTLEFHEYIPGKLEAALLEDQIDYGVTYLPIPTRGIEHIEITRVSMGIFAAAHSELHRTPFETLPFAAPVSQIEGAPTRVRGLDGWPDDRIPRTIRYRVALMETAMSLVRQGLAVAYLPKFIAKIHNEDVKPQFKLIEIAPPKPLGSKQSVYAIKKNDREEDRDFRAICKALRKL